MSFSYKGIIDALNGFASRNLMAIKAYQPNYRGVIDAINALESFGNRGSGVVASNSTIAQGDLLYIDSNGYLKPALANNIDTAIVVGAALSSASAGETVTYGRNMSIKLTDIPNSVDNSPSALVPGSRYFLSYSNDGNYTTTPNNTTQGAIVACVGTAVSTTEITIEIDKVLKIQ